MKTLRWKSSYAASDPELTARNHRLLECFNGFVQAVKQPEHCQDAEELVTRMGSILEHQLAEDPSSPDLADKVRQPLLESLPLPTFATEGCRKCGMCDLAEQHIAAHLNASFKCLGIKVET